MVAKTYLDWEQICKPYEKGGKMYVKVQKGNKTKEVRWLDYKEFAKKYPELADPGYRKYGYFSQKDALGFSKGYVYGVDAKENDSWCNASSARYNVKLGWYFFDEIDEDCPHKINKIMWEEVGNEEGYLI